MSLSDALAGVTLPSALLEPSGRPSYVTALLLAPNIPLQRTGRAGR